MDDNVLNTEFEMFSTSLEPVPSALNLTLATITGVMGEPFLSLYTQCQKLEAILSQLEAVFTYATSPQDICDSEKLTSICMQDERSIWVPLPDSLNDLLCVW